MVANDVEAFGMVKELAAREGVLSGSSGGANVFASLQVAAALGNREASRHHDSGFSRALSVEEDF